MATCGTCGDQRIQQLTGAPTLDLIATSNKAVEIANILVKESRLNNTDSATVMRMVQNPLLDGVAAKVREAMKDLSDVDMFQVFKVTSSLISAPPTQAASPNPGMRG